MSELYLKNLAATNGKVTAGHLIDGCPTILVDSVPFMVIRRQESGLLEIYRHWASQP